MPPDRLTAEDTLADVLRSWGITREQWEERKRRNSESIRRDAAKLAPPKPQEPAAAQPAPKARPRERRARSRSPSSGRDDPDEAEPPLGGVTLRKRSASVTLRRRRCEECGRSFDYQRSTARFCGAACKQRANRRLQAERKAEAEPPPALPPDEQAALMRRYEAALEVIGECDPAELLELVVWPSAELRAVCEAAA